MSEKHGLCKHPLYSVWQDMKNRCNNPNVKSYVNYGARGVKVCSEWAESFNAFYNWSLSTGYKKGLTIDRINNEDNYYPENCKWSTRKEQSVNRRRFKSRTGYTGVIHTPHNGKTYTAMIRHDNTQTHIGCYRTIKEAVEARNYYIVAHGLSNKTQEI